MYYMTCIILQYDTIHMIRTLYHTIYKHLRYADTIKNFLHTIRYISHIIRYWQLCSRFLSKKQFQKKKNTYNSKHIANQLSKLNLTTSTSIKKMKTHSYPQGHNQTVSKILLPISLFRPQPWQSTAIYTATQTTTLCSEVFPLKRFGIVSFIENFFGLFGFD